MSDGGWGSGQMTMSARILTTAMVPSTVENSGERARLRFLEFFTAQIRNPHTRRAYAQAVGEFLTWCESAGVGSLDRVQPLHVAAWIELEGREVSAPSVKQRLAAIRHLFDWLVTGEVTLAVPKLRTLPFETAIIERYRRHESSVEER